MGSTHLWGEENFDWIGLNEAVDLIEGYCLKWGRLGGQAKEKFGQVRFYAQFGLSIHNLIYPRWIYRKHDKFPVWLWKLDQWLQYKGAYRLINKVWIRYQEEVYSNAYLLAVEKYPHLRAEILCGADNPELIKGICRQRRDKEDWVLDILSADGKEVLGGWRSQNEWKDIR